MKSPSERFERNNQLKSNKQRREMRTNYHKGGKKEKALAAGVLAAFMGLLAFSLQSVLYPVAPSKAQGQEMSAEVGVNVREYIKVAVDKSTLALADAQGHTTISPDPNTGTQITGEVNVAVTTNTIKGYTLSIYTQDTSKNMTHSNPSVSTAIQSIDTVSGYDATTGASSLSNNTWGFRRYQAGAYGNWFAVGENEGNGTIIDSPSEEDSDYCENLSYPLDQTGCASSTYNTYQIGFGAKLTSELPAGTYTNNVVFSAVAKSEGVKYTMNFNANGGSNVMGPRTVLAGSNMVMPSTGFVKDGYGIKGWAMVSGATTATTPLFLAGQTVSINDLISAAVAAGQDVSQSSFTVYAVWDVPYTIAFDSNSGTGTMASQTIFQTNSNYTVPANGFTREGYNFTGWALSASGSVVYSPADTPTVSALISAASAAGQSVTPGTAGTITLYAVWEEATVWMQGFDCDARLPNIGDSTTAVDRRDNTTYTVKRLADDKCWMTENLILGHDKGYALTNEYTNIQSTDTATYYLPQAGYRGALNSSSTSGSATFDSNNDNQAQVQYRAQGQAGDQSSTGTLGQSTGYYNFYAATLGCSYYQDGLSSGQCASGYIQKDICPKGWQLPVGGNSTSTNQFSLLDIAMGGTGVNRTDATARDRFLNQASFLYSGNYVSSQLYNVGSNGYWWSDTVLNTYYSYNLYLDSSGYVYPQNYSLKYYGFAVRCVAQWP